MPATGEAIPKTRKEAEATGLQTRERWCRTRGPHMTPRRRQRATVVEGQKYYREDQCEEALSKWEANKRGMHVARGAKPVATIKVQTRSGFVPTEMFRISDCRPGRDKSEELINVTRLLQRGWSKPLIASLLGKPDDTYLNPHGASSGDVKLYRLGRVMAAETKPAFLAAQDGRDCRRAAAAARAVQTKREKTQAYVDGLKIQVPKLKKRELEEKACNHYNFLQAERGKFDQIASTNAKRDFLDRICVNYLRHARTSYESCLHKISGKVGRSSAYLEIREKVLEVIAEKYPYLESECERQIARMYEGDCC